MHSNRVKVYAQTQLSDQSTDETRNHVLNKENEYQVLIKTLERIEIKLDIILKKSIRNDT